MAGPMGNLGLIAGLGMAATPVSVLPPALFFLLPLSHVGSQATVTMYGQVPKLQLSETNVATSETETHLSGS